ncbi:MAG: tRNA (adenosine(37)-N6)-threonylcarbamoyltransferase complex ATPase subunit type 1 TsaE [Flavobacteriales bacterium AspAUS03]
MHSISPFKVIWAWEPPLIYFLYQSLGSIEAISNPTSSIIKEYIILKHKIYQFNFYCIKNEIEFYDLGYEDYFYSDAISLIEWSERVKYLLPIPTIA